MKTRPIAAVVRAPTMRRQSARAGAFGFAADRGSTRVPSTFSHRVPKQALHGLRRALSQLTDGGDADLGEPRLGGGTHAPHERHGQFVKELEFSRWIDDEQFIRLGDGGSSADTLSSSDNESSFGQFESVLRMRQLPSKL